MAEQVIPANMTAAIHSASATEFVDQSQSTNLVSDDERHWILLAKQGDLAAFDWLIGRYRQRAVRLAAHVLRRPADADDVVQESFLRAFSQIRTFRSDCSFYTWFYRIVVRLCLNRMRSPEWRHRRDVEETTGYDQVSRTPGPTETRALVEMLLDQLSPPLRATLVLREVTGLEYEEIAQTLGIPIGTVRSRLNAARSQFRVLWLQIQEETSNV